MQKVYANRCVLYSEHVRIVCSGIKRRTTRRRTNYSPLSYPADQKVDQVEKKSLHPPPSPPAKVAPGAKDTDQTL